RDLGSNHKGQPCSLVGCGDEIRVRLRGARERFQGDFPLRIRACQEGHCQNLRVDSETSACRPPTTFDGDDCDWDISSPDTLVVAIVVVALHDSESQNSQDAGAFTVSVTVSADSDSKPLFEAIGSAALSEPRYLNGKACGVTCYWGT